MISTYFTGGEPNPKNNRFVLMLSCTQECKGIKTFIYEGIDEQFLEYPENFRIFIFGLPEPSVKFYIGLIDDATYLVQNFEIEYHGRIE